MSTLEELQGIIIKEYGLEKAALSAEATLESVGLDSLAVAELIFSVEDHFEVRVPDDGATNIKTLGDVASLIDRLIAAKALAA